MSPKSLIVGIVLITCTMSLPVVGWRIYQKSQYDDRYLSPGDMLMVAARDGDVQKTVKLLSSGIKPDAGAEQGETALLAAVAAGKKNTVKVLLDHGANVNFVYRRNQERLDRSVKLHRDFMSSAVDGSTPITLCGVSVGQDLQIAKMLVAAGADLNAVDSDGATALATAFQGHSAPLVSYFVNKGGNCKVTDNHGSTILMWAIEINDTSLAKSAIKAGVDIDIIDINRQNALQLACKTNTMPEITKLLLKTTKDVNCTDVAGDSPLTCAIKAGQPSLVKALIARGANCNIPNIAGFTPLMFAAQKGDPAVVKFLLDAGAVTSVKNHLGHTALQIAKLRADEQCIQLLNHAESSSSSKLHSK